jgi:hypothetical protein
MCPTKAVRLARWTPQGRARGSDGGYERDGNEGTVVVDVDGGLSARVKAPSAVFEKGARCPGGVIATDRPGDPYQGGPKGRPLLMPQEAVILYRRLAAAHPAAFQPGLAGSLTTWPGAWRP